MKERYDDADKVIRKIASTNGASLPDNFDIRDIKKVRLIIDLELWNAFYNFLGGLWYTNYRFGIMEWILMDA